MGSPKSPVGAALEFHETRNSDRTIAVGDRLQWREPDNRRRISNGKYATVTALDRQNVEARFDNGRKVSMPLGAARKVDLGYCSASHPSQGSTVQRVIINIDSTRRAELVNARQFYVSSTRPEFELRIYTDSVQACAGRWHGRRRRNWCSISSSNSANIHSNLKRDRPE